MKYLTKILILFTIQLSNIILTGDEERPCLKYTDFFMAKEDPQPSAKLTKINTLTIYSAPELVNNAKDYNKPVDIWYPFVLFITHRFYTILAIHLFYFCTFMNVFSNVRLL
jgi:hypothetical protein